MSQNIKILSVKLQKDGEKMVLGIKESDLVKSDGELTYHDPVHPDLVNAVHGLWPHLALRTSLIKKTQIDDADEQEKYKVTGYSIGGKEGQEGITVTGMRKNEDGQYYSLNSPFTRIEGTEGNQYQLIGDLMDKIKKIEAEVKAYLFEGKKQAPELFSNKKDKKDEPVTNMRVAEELNDEEKGLANLNGTRDDGSGKNIKIPGHADPDAMKRIMDGDQSDFVKGEKKKLRGQGRNKQIQS
jgi:hypothetical protein